MENHNADGRTCDLKVDTCCDEYATKMKEINHELNGVNSISEKDEQNEKVPHPHHGGLDAERDGEHTEKKKKKPHGEIDEERETKEAKKEKPHGEIDEEREAKDTTKEEPHGVIDEEKKTKDSEKGEPHGEIHEERETKEREGKHTMKGICVDKTLKKRISKLKKLAGSNEIKNPLGSAKKFKTAASRALSKLRKLAGLVLIKNPLCALKKCKPSNTKTIPTANQAPPLKSVTNQCHTKKIKSKCQYCSSDSDSYDCEVDDTHCSAPKGTVYNPRPHPHPLGIVHQRRPRLSPYPNYRGRQSPPRGWGMPRPPFHTRVYQNPYGFNMMPPPPPPHAYRYRSPNYNYSFNNGMVPSPHANPYYHGHQKYRDPPIGNSYIQFF